MAIGAALAAAALTACTAPPPDAAAVETLGMRVAQTHDAQALQRLRQWADGGGPLARVAARELGLALAGDATQSAQALRWLTRAAEAGDAEAAFTLGEAYRTGRLQCAVSASVARTWFQRAADAGHAGATLALALAARHGDTEPRDPRRAARLLQLAAHRGSARAMYLLSQAYAEGEGLERDHALARHWLAQSAELHFPPAMQDWALALEGGQLGVERDLQAANEQWREATEERRNRWNLR